MKIDKDKRLIMETTTDLRSRAEDRWHVKMAESQPPRTKEEMLRLVHELEVHQIELELQNTELRRAQEELEASRNRYAELYEFAPVGYFTFDAHGLIRKVNLAGARLLGTEKRFLTNKSFVSFIADADGREIFFSYMESVLESREMQKCEISLTGKDCNPVHALIQGVTVENKEGKGGKYCIISSITDGTIARKMEDELQKAHDKLESIVAERTVELVRVNVELTEKIDKLRKSDETLQSAYTEINRMKDQLQAENMYLQKEVAQNHNFGEIIGKSNALEYVFLRVDQVAPMNATVLLLGETGVGKGVIARAIHSRSARKDRPLITVNCSSLPANLVESELFGRERGAFTGANVRQIGRFELANNGTIFLDEIGEMPMELQSKLLRVIQDGEFERLGSPHTIKIDVRIISASNRKLEEEIRNGRFREDLFYRLNVFPITVPPLRQRIEDIPMLVNFFVAKFNKKIGKKIETVSQDTLGALQAYHWPGNVRELESVIERSVITSHGSVLQVLDRFDTFPKTGELIVEDNKVLLELEQAQIVKILQKTGWRIEGKNGAAVLLGLNPSTLRARMQKYGIVRK